MNRSSPGKCLSGQLFQETRGQVELQLRSGKGGVLAGVEGRKGRLLHRDLEVGPAREEEPEEASEVRLVANEEGRPGLQAGKLMQDVHRLGVRGEGPGLDERLLEPAGLRHGLGRLPRAHERRDQDRVVTRVQLRDGPGDGLHPPAPVLGQAPVRVAARGRNVLGFGVTQKVDDHCDGF